MLLISLSALGLQSLMASADSSASDIVAAATAYVGQTKNAVTPEGLLGAVQAIAPTAQLAEDDFFIKHAVNGCYDEDKQYPLNIPGADGAVAAIFSVGDTRVPFTCAIAHTMELI